MYLSAIARRNALPADAGYPFSVASVKALESLTFETPITFFAGENASGKSTLLEALAAGMDAYAIGLSGRAKDDPYLSHASELAAAFYFARRKSPRIRMFLRSEDVLGYVRSLNAERLDDFRYALSKQGDEGGHDFEAVERSIIRNNELDVISHGERFLRILGDRLHGGGLYFLDEPEAPLSPVNQVALAQILLNAARAGGQFIVATHSPILLGVPGATIFEFTDEGIRQTRYEDLQSIRFLKRFMAAPERYIGD
jgi:predicted ATPase